MAPFASLDTRLQPPPLSSHLSSRLAGFQFKTIGQQPELLKRISTPNPNTQYDQDSHLLFSPSPESIRTLPESDNTKRPSLQDRLSSLLPSPAGNDIAADVTMADSLQITPDVDSRSMQNIDVSPMITPPTQTHGLYADSSRSPQGPSAIFLQNYRMGKEPDPSQDMMHTAMQEVIRTTIKQGATSPSRDSRFPTTMPTSATQACLSLLPVQTSTQTSSTNHTSSPFPSGEDVRSLMALHILQSRLSHSLSNFNPISTTNALAAAQSAKDQSTEMLRAAQRAHTLSQQASLLAQESMVAAQDCFDLAEIIQNQANLALSEVEKIRSGQGLGSGGEWEYNATIIALKDDLHQLAEWVRQRDAYESKHLRRLEEDEIKKCRKTLAFQLERGLNKVSADKQSHDLKTYSASSCTQNRIHEAVTMTPEDEADAATRAWNQHCEQSAERKRLAENELRKRREAEVELERQRLRAQFEVDAREAELGKLRAERLKAEEEEKFRQEKEALELQRRQQELEFARFLRSQKQNRDNLAKFATEEKKKVEMADAEREARLIAEQEQKPREIHEKENLKRQEMENTKASLLTENEAKRPAVERQQSQVSNILDRAKEKQFMATLTTENHNLLSQHSSLPPLPTHQAVVPPSSSHAEVGNTVSKKALLTNTQQSRTLSSNIPSSSVNLISSISSTLNSSTSLQNGPKFHEVTPSIPSSVDTLVFDTSGMSSSHTRSKSGDGVSNIGLSSSSPLTPLNQGNPSVPASTLPMVISIPPPTNLNGFEDIHSETNGPDTGNIPILPPSRVLPISPDAQRANLQPLLDANGISANVDDQQPFPSSVDQPSAATEGSRCKPLSPSQTNGDRMSRTSSTGSVKNPKMEPLHDVPILSMPTPPPPTVNVAPNSTAQGVKPKQELTDFKEIRGVTTPQTSLDLATSAQAIPLSGSFIPIPSKSKETLGPAAVQFNASPVKSNEQPPTLANTDQGFQVNESQSSSSLRPGPTDSWTQPMAYDSMAKTGNSSQNRLPPKRSRVLPPRIINDHYSPPRHISDDYSRDRHARRLSPPTMYDEDRRPLDVPYAGRKRHRDDDFVDAPLPRRYRHDSPGQDDNPLPDRDVGTANYARSPSPQSRLTPLALRLQPEKPSWDCYRPNYNDSDSFAYDPQTRNNKNSRYYQPIPQGSNYYGDASAQSNNDVSNDTGPLPLLRRFTDSAEQSHPPHYNYNNHHGPTRPRSLRGPRGGGNQALESRMSKPKPVSLINRLEDA